jgi:hypothetical protein
MFGQELTLKNLSSPYSQKWEGHAYYMMLFACQRTVNFPQYAHSFAVFMHVHHDRLEPRLDREQTFCLSWLPRRLEINFFGRPEPGKNFHLDETLNWAASLNAHVSAWGPFRIKPDLHLQARQRHDFLKSGEAQFVVLDNFHRPYLATNCIHAISDVGLTPQLFRTGTAYGNRATQKLVNYFQPWILEPDRVHPWAADLMNLSAARVAYRNRPAWSAAPSLLGYLRGMMPRRSACR